MAKKNLFLIAVFALGFAAGLASGEWHHLRDREANYFKLRRLHFYPAGGHLIDPIIEAEDPEGHDAALEAVKKKTQAVIDNAVNDGKASAVSVYLRDLNKTTWVGIRENDTYVSASLGKVPLMFTIFTKAQVNPNIFNKKIIYSSEIKSPVSQLTPPKDRLLVGQAYTVEQLLTNMIVYSDNISTLLLLIDKDADTAVANQIFSKLELPLPESGKTEYEISPKNYAKFFRTLYRATFLNKDLSEKALRLLAQSDFNAGIVAGVPRNVIVAHKFGESGDETGERQLHDCGIVYCRNHPYLLCVMTKGKNLAELESVIKDISSVVYGHFSGSQPQSD